MANADAAPRAVAAAACWAASCAVSRVPRMARGERTDSAVLDCLSPRRSAIGGQTALSDRSRGASRQICGCHILFPLFRISRAVALASVIEQMSSWRSVAVAVVCVCRDTCVSVDVYIAGADSQSPKIPPSLSPLPHPCSEALSTHLALYFLGIHSPNQMTPLRFFPLMQSSPGPSDYQHHCPQPWPVFPVLPIPPP